MKCKSLLRRKGSQQKPKMNRGEGGEGRRRGEEMEPLAVGQARAFQDSNSSQVSSTAPSYRSLVSQTTSMKKSGSNPDQDSPIPFQSVNMEEEWSKEPFVMPPDEEVFRLRALQKKRQEQKKVENMRPVSEKTTFASRMAATVASEMLRKELAEIDAQLSKEMDQRKSTTLFPIEHYHTDKENMAEFIAKKREIFLVQMSIDNKRAEIRKLQEKSFQREEALKKSEQMLAEDTLQFQAFLKQNDEKVQEAIKRAEQQTRLKQDKVAEIKRMNSNMATIKRDLNKFEEQLEECKKYKDFLVDLTPQEWLQEQLALHDQHLEKEEKQASKSEQKSRLDGLLQGSGVIEEEPEEDATKKKEPMYFTSPNQLLEIFSELEEKNLALMQESQDLETTLEDLKTRFNDMKQKNESRISGLQSQLEALKIVLKMEEERQRNLQSKTNVNIVDKKYDVTFEEIAEKVEEVYARCGLEVDPSLGTLQMLTSIEAKLEESIVALVGVPAEFIEQTEKAREKQRRLKLREEKMEMQRMEQEKRAERSLERAHAPIPKKLGKPVMFRSQLLKKEKEKQIEVIKTDDDKDLLEFLARDF